MDHLGIVVSQAQLKKQKQQHNYALTYEEARVKVMKFTLSLLYMVLASMPEYIFDDKTKLNSYLDGDLFDETFIDDCLKNSLDKLKGRCEQSQSSHEDWNIIAGNIKYMKSLIDCLTLYRLTTIIVFLIWFSTCCRVDTTNKLLLLGMKKLVNALGRIIHSVIPSEGIYTNDLVASNLALLYLCKNSNNLFGSKLAGKIEVSAGAFCKESAQWRSCFASVFWGDGFKDPDTKEIIDRLNIIESYLYEFIGAKTLKEHDGWNCGFFFSKKEKTQQFFPRKKGGLIEGINTFFSVYGIYGFVLSIVNPDNVQSDNKKYSIETNGSKSTTVGSFRIFSPRDQGNNNGYNQEEQKTMQNFK